MFFSATWAPLSLTFVLISAKNNNVEHFRSSFSSYNDPDTHTEWKLGKILSILIFILLSIDKSNLDSDSVIFLCVLLFLLFLGCVLCCVCVHVQKPKEFFTLISSPAFHRRRCRTRGLVVNLISHKHPKNRRWRLKNIGVSPWKNLLCCLPPTPTFPHPQLFFFYWILNGFWVLESSMKKSTLKANFSWKWWKTIEKEKKKVPQHSEKLEKCWVEWMKKRKKERRDEKFSKNFLKSFLRV